MVEFFAHITHEENSVTRPKHCYELHLLHSTHKAKLTQNRTGCTGSKLSFKKNRHKSL